MRCHARAHSEAADNPDTVIGGGRGLIRAGRWQEEYHWRVVIDTKNGFITVQYRDISKLDKGIYTLQQD